MYDFKRRISVLALASCFLVLDFDPVIDVDLNNLLKVVTKTCNNKISMTIYKLNKNMDI